MKRCAYSRSEVEKSQQQLKSSLLECDEKALKYARRPLGKAIIRGRGRPRVFEELKASPYDKVKCTICGAVTLRANKSRHKKSKLHQLYLKIEDKFRKYIIED